MYASKFQWTSIFFGYFCSVWGPILRLAWTSKMHCCKISWLWPATVCSIFTAIDANYTHLDTSIPVLQQLQPWIDTFIRLMLWKLSKIFFFHKLIKNLSAFFALMTLFLPPWPTMPLWYVVWIGERYFLPKGRAGSRGGTHPKINYRTLNEPPNTRSQQFFENQLNMCSHTKSVCRIW